MTTMNYEDRVLALLEQWIANSGGEVSDLVEVNWRDRSLALLDILSQLVLPGNPTVLDGHNSAYYLNRANHTGILPSVSVSRTTPQTLTTTGWQDVTHTTEDFDNSWSMGVPTINVGFPANAWYLINFAGEFEPAPDGLRALQLYSNNPQFHNKQAGVGVDSVGQEVVLARSVFGYATTSQYVKLQAWQSSGEDLDLNSAQLQVITFWKP